MMRSRPVPFCLVALVFLGLLATARPVHAAEVTAFVARASPGTNWGTGYGGTFSTTWFHVVALEAEVARQPGASLETSMTSFTASALLAPPLGKVIPYGGLGAGVYRQVVGTATDTGTLKALVLGAKVKLGVFFVLKAEYRRFSLSTSAPLAMNHRISAAAGISF
jgi:hypothetical protein